MVKKITTICSGTEIYNTFYGRYNGIQKLHTKAATALLLFKTEFRDTGILGGILGTASQVHFPNSFKLMEMVLRI
jgi:hypothetical protein